MFDQSSYIGYTLIFCLPPILILWLRREFFYVLCAYWRPISLSTCLLTIYGSLIWPVALYYGAWAYDSGRITNWKLFRFVYIDDVVWWFLVSFLISSFVALSAHYEKSGTDIVWREIRALVRSFFNAFHGFRIISLERNSTIHVAVSVFVLLEAVLFRVSTTEWMFISAAIALVLGFEIFNSALERIATKASAVCESTSCSGNSGGEPRSDEIALIKDAAAAGVLVSAIGAAAIGLLIFFHRLWGAL